MQSCVRATLVVLAVDFSIAPRDAGIGNTVSQRGAFGDVRRGLISGPKPLHSCHVADGVRKALGPVFPPGETGAACPGWVGVFSTSLPNRVGT